MADQMAEAEKLKAPMLLKDYYAIVREPQDDEAFRSVYADHLKWLIGLEKEGKVLLSGPLLNEEGKGVGGITLIRAGSFDEAREIGAADPLHISGAMTWDIQRFVLSEGSFTVTVNFSDQSFDLP